MLSSLIIYSSTDGHTRAICERIINFSKNKSIDKIVSLNEALKLDISKYDMLIIGASIRYGKHSKQLYKFIKLNKNILDKKDSVFFFSQCSYKKTRKKYS